MENKIINERVATSLATSDFYYDLPEELIAQSPSDERDGCRLMVLDRENGSVEHKIFRDIIDYLSPEDMLVVNSSKVYNEDYEKMKELASELGSLPDAVAEKINEAFSDNFGDVILECVDDGYAVIADYREDVENWLTKIVR